MTVVTTVITVLVALAFVAGIMALVPWIILYAETGRIPNPMGPYLRYVDWVDARAQRRRGS